MQFKGLDLFCGGGGCTAGYMRGFRPGELHMTGVDKWFQYRYIGDDYWCTDVMELLDNEAWIDSFDFIHASPPCQFFSPTGSLTPDAEHRRIDLLTPLLEIIRERYSHKIWIIENVPQAPLYTRRHGYIQLCASSFPGHTGFDTRRLLHRHRAFRLYNLRVPPLRCNHNGYKPLSVFGALNSEPPGGGEQAANMAEAEKLMDIKWMKWHELKEAVPPSYTEYITASPGGLRDTLFERYFAGTLS